MNWKKILLMSFAVIGMMITGETNDVYAQNAQSQILDFQKTKPHVEMLTDISYFQSYGWPKINLKMDILRPQSNIKQPLVVFIPGGGFIADDKNFFIQQRLRLAEAGYVVASVEYRTVPNGSFPDPIVDIKSAIRYLRANADEFGIDPEHVAIMGESAGGYMAAMVGTSNGVKKFDKGENLDQSSDVQAAIDIYGLSDLTKVSEGFSDEVIKQHQSAGAPEALYVNGMPLFGRGSGSIAEHPDKANEANPMTYISKKSAPFLLMHGDKDTLVSPKQTERLHQALTDKGIGSTRYVVHGAGHADAYWDQPEITKILIDFLDMHLKK